ncbi:ATP-binding cassette domain-containing protein [Actinomyces wuliandei]|uniref:ATP-binding cassette domain-containing protein n=1 Tax=Actinomyces wuliandei TaxID=2057743 RepID=UPI001118B4B7|nr:ABC transporter ATP-binding protein [Actinomyces wuliandei]
MNAADSMPALAVRGVSKRFGRTEVFRDVSFTVAPGRSLAVVGANGCGKSTLLKICAGLVSPTAGEVRVTGRLGYCPQHADLAPRLTAQDHITWLGSGLGLAAAVARRQGEQIASALHMRDSRRQVRRLSGGTAQKVNLVCSMMGGPDVLLLDEPYQGFDEGAYLDFWDLVESWCRQGIAVVVVTHMLRELHRVDFVLDLGGRAE